MTVRARATYFARAASQDFRHAPFVHLVSIVTLSVALLGLGAVRAAMGVADDVVSGLRTDVELTVYLDEGVSPAEAETVRGVLAAKSGGTGKLIAPADALSRLGRELGSSAQALSDLPENPLPYSIEVRIPREKHSPESLAALAKAFRSLNGVEAVDYGEQAVARLARLSEALRVGGIAALFLLAVAAVVTVAATFQLSIYARRAEVEIQKLVGATDAFVRAPFLIEGALQGAIAAGFAAGALSLGLGAVAPGWLELLAFLGLVGVGVPEVTPRLVGELVVVGTLLGLFGSGVAVRRFLRA